MNIRHAFALISTLLVVAFSAYPQATETRKTSTETTAAEPLGPREKDGSLSLVRAKNRSARVSEIHYGLHITLDPELDHFAGTLEIKFDLEGSDEDLTVDFAGGEIAGLTVNDTAVADAYNGEFVTLPAANLVAGTNIVTMSYTRPWSNDGTGLYRYDDPTDGNVYLYTDLEHYDAHLWIPVFDQPDLKATYNFTVVAPPDWQVISTTRETSAEDGPEGWKNWTFPATPVMSSYLISLHAGPYAVWEDPDFRYPLRVFSRQALAKYMDPEVWFKATRGSFDALESYYDLPYPYKKYDQIVVPDFNAGAMENIAAVTFSERFVDRDGHRDREEQLRLVGVIGHEMAHMWFGDLVTMRWWNGLWLNESFAAYMGYFVLESLGYDEAWDAFFLRGKTDSYNTDRRVTTHAVETPVESTDNVYDNFDAISYSKGASVLRQAAFLIGEDNFRDGIRIYLKRHAGGNTDLDDFVGALGEAAGKDLDDFAKEWLYTPGVNTIQAEYSCTDGFVDAFALKQTAPENYPVLRTQRVQVGFYTEADGVVSTTGVFPVTYSGERTEVPAAIGEPCPTLVYPNHGDFGYAVVALDPRTLENLAEHISAVEDSFQRIMFWAALIDQARSGAISVPESLDVVLAAANEEDNRGAITQVYGHASTALGYLASMGEPGAELLAEYAPRVETMIWERLLHAKPEQKTLFFDRYREAAFSHEGLARMAAMLDGELEVPGLKVDQARRWQILSSLASKGRGDVLARADAELERDKSAQGRRSMISIRAAYPDAETKSKFLDDLFDPASKTSYSDHRAAVRSLFDETQQSLHEQFADRIIAHIAATEAESDPKYFMRARLITSGLTPTTCSEASVDRLAKMVEAHQKSRESILRYITERWEDDARCVARIKALE